MANWKWPANYIWLDPFKLIFSLSLEATLFSSIPPSNSTFTDSAIFYWKSYYTKPQKFHRLLSMFSSLSALRNRISCSVLIFVATSRSFDKSTSRQLAFFMIFKTTHKIIKQIG